MVSDLTSIHSKNSKYFAKEFKEFPMNLIFNKFHRIFKTKFKTVFNQFSSFSLNTVINEKFSKNLYLPELPLK